MVKRRKLGLETLEDRCTPVTWPIAGAQPGAVVEILGTYGQYQERELSNDEKATRFANHPLYNQVPAATLREIHIHEGLDIKANAGDPVRAVMGGWVEAVFNYKGQAFNSFVVIRDDLLDPAGGSQKGWNYKHVIPNANLKKGARVLEGDPIGTVAQNPPGNNGGYGDHVHLDRGEAKQPEKNAYRDPTLPELYLIRLAKRNLAENRFTN